MRRSEAVAMVAVAALLFMGFAAGYLVRSFPLYGARAALETARAERDALRAERDALQAQLDALQARGDSGPSSPLDALDALPEKHRAHLAYLAARAVQRLEEHVLQAWIEWGYAVGAGSEETRAEAEAVQRAWLEAALAPLATPEYVASRVEFLAEVQRGGEGEFTFPEHRVIREVEVLESTGERLRARFRYDQFLPGREWNAGPSRQTVEEVVTLVRRDGAWRLAAVDRSVRETESIR